MLPEPVLFNTACPHEKPCTALSAALRTQKPGLFYVIYALDRPYRQMTDDRAKGNLSNGSSVKAKMHL
jgi:hypothetical protein